MSTKLTYFDFDASRGLECRLALAAAGVPFEDVRIQRPQWPALKPTVPFGALPVLEVEGRRIAQSNAILRYIGAAHGLHPTDPWTAARHDALMQSVEDLRYKIPGRGLSDEDKKTKREEFAAGWLTHWLGEVEGNIQGPFVEGAQLNVVDIKLYTILRAVLGGTYDHIDPAAFARFEKVHALFDAVDGHPAVRGWFS